MREGEAFVGGEGQQAGDGVLELAHVAGPGVRAERVDEGGLHVDLPHAVAIGVGAHERGHERVDVLHTLAQRRDADGHHVEAVEQVLTEAAGLRLGGEVAVRRGNEADVDLLGSSAHRLHLARLQRAENLRLHRQRQLTDLVDEQRAVLGLLEVTAARAHGARERALGVAEELGLGQLARDGGGVEANERLVRAARVRVQGRGHHVLARAALTGEQHGDVLRGDARHHVEDALHAGAARGDGAPERVLRAQTCILQPKLTRLDGALHGQHELVGIERLGDVVPRAGLHGGHGDALGAVRGEHEHGDARIRRAHLLQHLHTVDVGHGEVRHHHVSAAGLERREPLRAALVHVHGEPSVRQHRLERVPERRVVVDDEDPAHRRITITTRPESRGAPSLRSPSRAPSQVPPRGRRRARGWGAAWRPSP